MVVRELIVKLRMSVDRSSMGAARASINSTKGALATMAASGSRAGMAVSRGLATIRTGAAQAAAGVGMIRNSINGLMGALGPLAGAMAAAFTVSSIKSAADTMMNLDNRLKTVTNSQQERYDLEEKLYKLSRQNRQGLAEMSSLYYTVARSAETLGTTEADNLRVTDVVSKALTLGGASAQEASASILQLGQALGSGVLQGDELHSLNENAGLLMQTMAKSMGVTIGDLKQMGAEGQLTSKAVVEAILKSGDVIDRQFLTTTMTIGQASTIVGNLWLHSIDRIEKRTQIFSSIARSIVGVFDEVESTFNTFMDLAEGPKEKTHAAWLDFQQLQEAHPILVMILNTFRAIGDAINFIQDLLGTSNIVAKFIMISAAVMVVGGILSLLGSAIMSVVGVATGLYTVLSAAFGVVTTLGWPLVAVFAAIAAAIYYVREHWDEVVAAFEPGLDRMKNGLQLLQDAWIAIQPLIQALIPLLKIVADFVGGVIVGAIKVLWDIATTAFEAIASVINIVASALGRVGDLIQWCADGLASLINKGKEFLGMRSQFDATGSALESRSQKVVNIEQNNTFTDTSNQGQTVSEAYTGLKLEPYW